MSLKTWGVWAPVLGAVIATGMFCSGCGDYFRPVANPEPPTIGGNPLRSAHAVVLSSNGSSPGTAVIIDIPGDTEVGLFSGETFGIGRNPVFATSIAGRDYVLNRDDNNVASFTTPVAGTPLSLSVVTLPSGATPVFAAVAQSKVFVAESGLGLVADISSNAPPIPVGANPVALVAPPSPNDTQLYSLNQGDNTVSIILPSTDQNITPTNPLQLPAGAKPVWAAASTDGTRIFVVNQGTSSVSVIDTVNNVLIPPGASCPQDTFCVGSGPNYIFYDPTLNRFYITSPADGSLTIINNNVDTATCVNSGATCVQKVFLNGAPCNGQHPVSVTALADGSRAYVADDVTNSLCVLDTTSNTFTKNIPVGLAPVFVVSDPDSRRVLTANSGSGAVSIIETDTDAPVPGNNGPLIIPTDGTPTFIAVTD